MQIIEPIDMTFSDFINSLIKLKKNREYIFLSDIDDDNGIQSLHITITQKDNESYVVKICYQDEGDTYHDVYGGETIYNTNTGKYSNCILYSKYDDIHIELNNILGNFFI